MWTCKNCKEKHDNDEIHTCWKCEHDKSGVIIEFKEEQIISNKDELSELSKKYKSLRIYKNILYVSMIVGILIGVLAFLGEPEAGFFIFIITFFMTFIMLQAIKIIDFLFDLSEEKADK